MASVHDIRNSDDDSVSSEEALNELLGLTTASLKTAIWDEDVDLPAECKEKTQISVKAADDSPPNSFTFASRRFDVTTMNSSMTSKYQEPVIERAYHMAKDSIEPPPIEIVNLTEENQGNILVAKRCFRKGEVIFTEKSLVSIQQPSKNGNIRACEMCFKSLESGLCLSRDPIIPYVELWPIREINIDTFTVIEPYQHLMEDSSSGFVICNKCHTRFCSRSCTNDFTCNVGHCCSYKQAIHYATQTLSVIDSSDDKILSTDPVYILATRMFCMLVHRFRCGESLNLFDGNCGDELDITPLRLGDCDKSGVYSMESAYELISKALSLTVEERQGPLSLKIYHRLTAVAQRNGIHLSTFSPFRGYYDAILRHTGGRCSSRQKEITRELAKVLGAPDGKLSKDMDRTIEAKCVVQVCSIFTLTALMNHSCDPVAEIRGGEYIDSRIDVVAKANIEKGQEVTISYIDLRSESSNRVVARNKRQKHLESKYLFKCTCRRCVNMDF